VIQRHEETLNRDHLLIISDQPEHADLLRERYPDCEVESVSSFLSGIDRLRACQARGVLAFVGTRQLRLSEAVAGLREAAGQHTRLLLCCEPENEPAVRSALDSGADDYLILPLNGAELDEALGFSNDTWEPDDTTPAATMQELDSLTDVVGDLEASPFNLLSRLADLVRLAMQCTSVTLVAEGSVATSGAATGAPALSEPIRDGGRTLGQITVGGRDQPYAPADTEKLRHYARLAGRVLTASARLRRWKKQAMTDDLSGLHNRRYATQFLAEILERARDERFRVTVLIFDIDDFKTYNDQYGHTAGDEIIQRVGQLFLSHCREHDVVCRYGGDEFCVIFWDADEPRVAGSSHPTDALAVLDRCKDALKSYRYQAAGQEERGEITISGGLASFPWDGSEAADLIAKADHALIEAKRAGKNQVLLFETCKSNGSEPTTGRAPASE